MNGRKALASIAFLTLAVQPVTLGAATTDTETVTLPISADAWYDTAASGCATIVGCFPAPAPQRSYPEDTLHVGTDVGLDSARTYVALDLLGIPAGARVTGGSLTLPLTTAKDAGVTTPEAATVRACLATGVISDDAEASTRMPPSIDCSTGGEASFGNAAFTVDLAPFFEAWNEGAPAFGIALIPDAEPPDSWRVAFDARSRRDPGARHVTAVVTVETQSADPQPAPVGTPRIDVNPPPALPPLDLPTGLAAPPPAVSPPPPPAPSVARPVAANGGFRYPAAMLVPLALLGAWMFLTRTFTRDPRPAGGWPTGRTADATFLRQER